MLWVALKREGYSRMVQVGDRDPEFVFHLILDSTKCQKVEGLDQFSNLEVLSMNSCGLTSLAGFPKLPQLKEVIPTPYTTFTQPPRAP